MFVKYCTNFSLPISVLFNFIHLLPDSKKKNDYEMKLHQKWSTIQNKICIIGEMLNSGERRGSNIFISSKIMKRKKIIKTYKTSNECRAMDVSVR